MSMIYSGTVTAPTPMTFSLHPQSQTVATSADLNLTSSVTGGTGAITWAWYKNGVAIAGKTGTDRNAFLNLPTGQFATNNVFTVKFSDAAPSTVTSNGATITVSGCALPVIQSGTESPTYNIPQGDHLTIEATATGADTWTTQWFNPSTSAWSPLTNGTGNNSYWLSNGTADTGYQDLDYKSTFTNTCGTVERISKINVIYALSVSTQPTNQTAPGGTTASFSTASSNGTAPVTVQWYRNGVAIPGKTSTTLTLTVLETDSAVNNNETFFARFTDSASPTPATVATNTVSVSRTPVATGSCECINIGNDCCDYVGWPYAMDGPSNIPLKYPTTKVAMPFCAPFTGNITSYAWIMKYCDSCNYSAGDEGHIRTCLYNADANGDPTGNALGCDIVLDPKGAGDGTQGTVAKLEFDSSIPVVAGQKYAIVIDNVHPQSQSNWLSVNLGRQYPFDGESTTSVSEYNFMTANGFYQPRMQGPADDFHPTTNAPNWYKGDPTQSPQSNAGTLPWHRNLYSLWYSTGDRVGQDYVGAPEAQETTAAKTFSTTSRYRTYFKPKTDRVGTELSFYTRYNVNSGTMVGRVKTIAGLTLGQATLTPDTTCWFKGTLDTPVNLTGGTRYYVEWSSSFDHTVTPIYTSANGFGWAEDPVREQAHLAGHGLTWSDNSGSSYYTPTRWERSTHGGWYISTTCGSGGGGTTRLLPNGSKISFVGHSLMNVGTNTAKNFSASGSGGLVAGQGLLDAMSPYAFTCPSINSNPGGNVTAAVADLTASRTRWVNSDAIVLDYIINGDETKATFKTNATNAVNYIRSQSATIKIIWMQGHASTEATQPPGAQANVQSRWQDKNPALSEMFTAGTIDGVVPWASFAEANKTPIASGGLFYNTDGVHHHANGLPYAQQMCNYLASLTV